MKKLILTISLICTICFAVEIRTFLEQELNYDKNYYSDLGLDVRFKADNALFQIKRGIVFSSLKKPFAVGNHEWYYVGFNTQYNTGFGTVYAEILTEKNPFEGNDFGLTKQISTQSLGYGLGPFDIKREKVTNGDFFSEVSWKFDLDKSWYSSTLIITGIGKSARGTGNLLNILDDDLYAVQISLANWIKIPLRDKLDFAVRGQVFGRNYVSEGSTDLGYTISVGLIAN